VKLLTVAEPVRQRQTRRLHRRILWWGGVGLIAGLLLLQLHPYGRTQTNPPVLAEPVWDRAETRRLTVRACYDCHSNETYWPWYSQIAPLSMQLYNHVTEGRQALNFSEWNSQAWEADDLDRLIEVVQKGQMPPTDYLVLNPQARLTTAETGQLINGLIATLGDE
jgi:hypothetical protein